MRPARLPGSLRRRSGPGGRVGPCRCGAVRRGGARGAPRPYGRRAGGPSYGHSADQPDQRSRSGDVRDRRRRVALLGVGPADHARDASLIAFHQACPPAPPAPCPSGRSRRAGWGRGRGAHQPERGAALSEQEMLRLLNGAASDLGVTAWIVGGYVRDAVLERPHPNPDVVVEEGDGLELARRFAELAGAPPPVVFERFGTAQVTLPGRLVEFVSARAESYAPDSRKPEVRRATLEEDLRRRDFTISTLLMDFDGNIQDMLGARPDLQAKVLRTPADPMLTFTDDPLRMLRAVRFAAELGFTPAPDLVPAMRRLGSRLAPPVVSIERTADELRRMLASERPKLALELLDETGLLEVILPEIATCKGVPQSGFHTHDVFGHTLLTVAATPPDLLLRVAALFHDAGKPKTAKGDGTLIGHE